jgi:anti-sigma-K factor RskA
MSDFADRLAALDPAAGQPYQHRNLDALISRVTAEPRRAPRRLWRSIELKVAASLVVVTAVAAGAIAILQGGPALAPLAIQNTNTKFAVASPYKSATIELNNEYKFSAGEALAQSQVIVLERPRTSPRSFTSTDPWSTARLVTTPAGR